jgi:hypothetical protein
MKAIGRLLAGVLGRTQAQVNEFEPANDLERALLQAQTGKLSYPDFFANLLKSQVVILLDRVPPQSGAWDNSISPLVLISSKGSKVLAVYTSTERATPMSRQSKEHKYSLLTGFSGVFRGVASGVGIVVNPGWPVGVEIDAARIAELKGNTK